MADSFLVNVDQMVQITAGRLTASRPQSAAPTGSEVSAEDAALSSSSSSGLRQAYSSADEDTLSSSVDTREQDNEVPGDIHELLRVPSDERLELPYQPHEPDPELDAGPQLAFVDRFVFRMKLRNQGQPPGKGRKGAVSAAPRNILADKEPAPQSEAEAHLCSHPGDSAGAKGTGKRRRRASRSRPRRPHSAFRNIDWDPQLFGLVPKKRELFLLMDQTVTSRNKSSRPRPHPPAKRAPRHVARAASARSRRARSISQLPRSQTATSGRGRHVPRLPVQSAVSLSNDQATPHTHNLDVAIEEIENVEVAQVRRPSTARARATAKGGARRSYQRPRTARSVRVPKKPPGARSQTRPGTAHRPGSASTATSRVQSRASSRGPSRVASARSTRDRGRSASRPSTAPSQRRVTKRVSQKELMRRHRQKEARWRVVHSNTTTFGGSKKTTAVGFGLAARFADAPSTSFAGLDHPNFSCNTMDIDEKLSALKSNSAPACTMNYTGRNPRAPLPKGRKNKQSKPQGSNIESPPRGTRDSKNGAASADTTTSPWDRIAILKKQTKQAIRAHKRQKERQRLVEPYAATKVLLRANKPLVDTPSAADYLMRPSISEPPESAGVPLISSSSKESRLQSLLREVNKDPGPGHYTPAVTGMAAAASRSNFSGQTVNRAGRSFAFSTVPREKYDQISLRQRRGDEHGAGGLGTQQPLKNRWQRKLKGQLDGTFHRKLKRAPDPTPSPQAYQQVVLGDMYKATQTAGVSFTLDKRFKDSTRGIRERFLNHELVAPSIAEEWVLVQDDEEQSQADDVGGSQHSVVADKSEPVDQPVDGQSSQSTQHADEQSEQKEDRPGGGIDVSKPPNSGQFTISADPQDLALSVASAEDTLKTEAATQSAADTEPTESSEKRQRWVRVYRPKAPLIPKPDLTWSTPAGAAERRRQYREHRDEWKLKVDQNRMLLYQQSLLQRWEILHSEEIRAARRRAAAEKAANARARQMWLSMSCILSVGRRAADRVTEHNLTAHLAVLLENTRKRQMGVIGRFKERVRQRRRWRAAVFIQRWWRRTLRKLHIHRKVKAATMIYEFLYLQKSGADIVANFRRYVYRVTTIQRWWRRYRKVRIARLSYMSAAWDRALEANRKRFTHYRAALLQQRRHMEKQAVPHFTGKSLVSPHVKTLVLNAQYRAIQKLFRELLMARRVLRTAFVLFSGFSIHLWHQFIQPELAIKWLVLGLQAEICIDPAHQPRFVDVHTIKPTLEEVSDDDGELEKALHPA